MTDIVKRLRAFGNAKFPVTLKAADEIERLRQWIREEGLRSDTCTRHILGKVCDNCRCGKAKS